MSEDVVLPPLDLPLNDGRVLHVESMSVRRGERLVLFGPNGAGKSTALRSYAGLIGGVIGAEDAAYLPQRPYMFRGSAGHNLRLGLDDASSDRATALASRLGLGERLRGPAQTLSGGERARLGIARVLAQRASLVLLDEPLAALDARDRANAESVIVDQLSDSAALIVTHDRDVAAAVADRMAVMIDGTIRQVGPVGAVFSTPADDLVADVVGIGNVLRGAVSAIEAPLVRVVLDAPGSSLEMWALGDQDPGSQVAVMFGAEAVTVFSGEGVRSSARNRWRGTVESIRQMGRLVEVVVDVGVPVVALITPGSLEALELAPGRSVALAVKATAVQAVVAPGS